MMPHRGADDPTRPGSGQRILVDTEGVKKAQSWPDQLDWGVSEHLLEGNRPGGLAAGRLTDEWFISGAIRENVDLQEYEQLARGETGKAPSIQPYQSGFHIFPRTDQGGQPAAFFV